MKDMKLAAQLFTIRDFLKTPMDIETSLIKIKEIGYEWIQVSGMGPISHEQMREILNRTGLKVCSTHIPFDRLQRDIKEVIYQHRLWGCSNIGIGMMPKEYERSEAGYISFAKDASAIGRELSENGFRFTYHNHRIEFEKYNGRLAMDILAQETDPTGFDFLLDTFWIQSGGSDPVEWINKLSNRIKVIHFKDMIIRDDKQLMGEVGEGNLNWGRMIEACRNSNVEWIAVEQDDCNGKDPFECLKLSYDNLVKFLG